MFGIPDGTEHIQSIFNPKWFCTLVVVWQLWEFCASRFWWQLWEHSRHIISIIWSQRNKFIQGYTGRKRGICIFLSNPLFQECLIQISTDFKTWECGRTRFSETPTDDILPPTHHSSQQRWKDLYLYLNCSLSA